MNNSTNTSLLKSVSRSFYLSMRVLPTNMRQSVTLAYLLARAADSVADCEALDRQTKQHYIQLFRHLLLAKANTDELQNMNENLLSSITLASEKKLLAETHNIFQSYYLLPKEDFSAVQKVVLTLTEGMLFDLQKFNNDTHIAALNSGEELDNYTYLVAGCVGEFWTTVSINHAPAMRRCDKLHMEQLGIEFGKALQLTNIIRDIAKDAQLGRCYVPIKMLEIHNLSAESILNKENNLQLRPIVRKLISNALQYFDSAESYFNTIPRYSLRLRLAALWPILIGIQTLACVAKKENFLDPAISIKVSRKWVYRMLALSLIRTFSNTLTSIWIKKLRSSIDLD